MILLLAVVMQPKDILRFAYILEKEGDAYRAITEYKRFLYYKPDADSIRYRIVYLYTREGLYGNAIDVMRTVIRKDSLYKETMGFLFYRAGIYDSVYTYWKDKKIGLIDLQKGKFREGLKKLGMKNISPPGMKSPVASAFLSAIVPGLGRIYAGRVGDGVYTLLTIASTSYFAYSFYRENKNPGAYIFAGLSLFFYAGDIFGSYIAANMHNNMVKEKFIQRIEREVF